MLRTPPFLPCPRTGGDRRHYPPALKRPEGSVFGFRPRLRLCLPSIPRRGTARGPPRHFRVSQEVWRPITRMYPQEVKSQGYIMGAYYVFDTEYRQKRFLDYPIDRSQGIDEYAQVLVDALDAAPEDGLILYIQDLELMDFGDVALDLLRAAWTRVLATSPVDVRFETPDEFLDSLPGPPRVRVEHRGMGWAPETRVLLRSDGHYPPLYAGEYGGLDAVPQIFRPHPFVYWEPGK